MCGKGCSGDRLNSKCQTISGFPMPFFVLVTSVLAVLYFVRISRRFDAESVLVLPGGPGTKEEFVVNNRKVTKAGSGLAVVAVALSLTACGTTQTKSAVSAKKIAAPTTVAQLAKFTNRTGTGKLKNSNLVVAWAETSEASPWRVAEVQSFQAAAKALGVHLIWNQAHSSATTELSNVQDLLAQHPDVLIVDPEDTAPLTPVVTMADSAHVPLIVIDREISKKPGQGEYQLFIGAHQFPIGYDSAEAWIHYLKEEQHTSQPKAHLAIIEGGVGQSPTVGRNNGALAAIKPYPGIKVVAIESGDWDLQPARTAMESFIQRFPPGYLQGVFAASDEMLMGAEEAMHAAHRTIPSHFFFSGDGQLQGLQAVVQGISAADTQNPPFYGLPSLEAAIAISQGANFHGESLYIPNYSYNCMTGKACSITKKAIAAMHGHDF